MPRVVSGKARGIVLEAPKGMSTRPTSDKVKESVFNILMDRTYGSRFLDVFAGTGQMGIEALSRGAEFAVFFDQGKDSYQCIRKNLMKTHLDEKAQVLMTRAQAGIVKLQGEPPFDIVYVDPPFDRAIPLFSEIVALLNQHRLLAESSSVILEHRSTDNPEAFVMNLKLKRSCKYGTIMVSFYDRA